MTPEREFYTGDYVRIRCIDGAEFEGVLEIQDDYILLNGYGFAHGIVDDMWVTSYATSVH